MWNLLLEGMQNQFHRGPDQDDYEAMKVQVFNKYKNDQTKNCLQVGVNYPYKEKFGPNFVAIDKHDKRPCIDVNCDLAELPFEENSFDFIVCNAILEHVMDPFGCCREMSRVARLGCEIWCEVPFAQPFHPTKHWKYEDGYILDTFGNPNLPADENHGGDFWRFTPQGLAVVLKDFEPKKFYIAHAGGIAFHGVRK